MIRDAKTSDAARMLEIYAYYVEHTAISFETEAPSLMGFEERIRRTTARYPWIVIEEDGLVLGYAYAGPFKGRAAYDWSCQTTIYLSREAQKQGLGRTLYEALETRLRDMGILNLYACIGVPAREDEYLTRNSADFHAHLGYRQCGEFRQCGSKFGRWYDMIWMEKIIGGHVENPPAVQWRTV